VTLAEGAAGVGKKGMTSVADGARRDYSTISPSALSLLLMKAQTAIPFAKDAAALVYGDSAPSALEDTMDGGGAVRSLKHFVKRYRSLDLLLREVALPRILEIGAGLSFRGLELARTTSAFYVDTDLPSIAELKAELVTKLRPGPLLGTLLGTLLVRPLDALDRAALRATIELMPAGPLAIANEGLLIYLNAEEKARLAQNVRAVLLARGGVWLTADVYIRNPADYPSVFAEPRARKFLDAHRVDENKFSDWADAERFFADNGFSIQKKLVPDHSKHVRETWALSAR
jgi:O-methyltransferase involved in polyketide biosynthesis